MNPHTQEVLRCPPPLLKDQGCPLGLTWVFLEAFLCTPGLPLPATPWCPGHSCSRCNTSEDKNPTLSPLFDPCFVPLHTWADTGQSSWPCLNDGAVRLSGCSVPVAGQHLGRDAVRPAASAHLLGAALGSSLSLLWGWPLPSISQPSPHDGDAAPMKLHLSQEILILNLERRPSNTPCDQPTMSPLHSLDAL